MFYLSLSIFLISVLGILIIVGRKISQLKKISLFSFENFDAAFLIFVKRKLNDGFKIIFSIYYLFINFLEKFLLRLKIISLKTYNKSHNMLETIREHKNDKNKKDSDNNSLF